ncbi:protein TRACHEARY ELEMENT DIFFERENTIATION-RELATED 6 [Sesamum angolense]|uniref:Protein TRACHEARY ELEMENT DIFFERENTIATION-RELATED 6 n=1 Tax=Sesamum angolense TaxID=2727404 RepID=A0AAE2BJ69_9LAMI|nr:protein TRACHEARY ELEMENT DIFFERENTIATION-RELATED 6 [Sesamum angolense]
MSDPISSPSSTDNGPTVVVVVFISLGCVFFFGVCLFAFWFLIKRWKMKSVQETDIIRDDEHLKVKEDIVKGPFGPQAVILSIEEDKHLKKRPPRRRSRWKKNACMQKLEKSLQLMILRMENPPQILVFTRLIITVVQSTSLESMHASNL